MPGTSSVLALKIHFLGTSSVLSKLEWFLSLFCKHILVADIIAPTSWGNTWLSNSNHLTSNTKMEGRRHTWRTVHLDLFQEGDWGGEELGIPRCYTTLSAPCRTVGRSPAECTFCSQEFSGMPHSTFLLPHISHPSVFWIEKQ